MILLGFLIKQKCRAYFTVHKLHSIQQMNNRKDQHIDEHSTTRLDTAKGTIMASKVKIMASKGTSMVLTWGRLWLQRGRLWLQRERVWY